MPVTAKNAKVAWSTNNSSYSDLIDVTNWDVSDESDNKDYASSSTTGHRKRVAGNGDSSGSFEMLVDDEVSTFAKGDTGYFRLYMTGANYKTYPCIIDSIEYEADIDGAELVKATVSWSGNGAPTAS